MGPAIRKEFIKDDKGRLIFVCDAVTLKSAIHKASNQGVDLSGANMDTVHWEYAYELERQKRLDMSRSETRTPEVTENDHKRAVMEKLGGIDGGIGWLFRWVSELERASTGSAEKHTAAVRLALHSVLRALEAGVCGLARELEQEEKNESGDNPVG